MTAKNPRLINLTGSDINVYEGDVLVATIPSSGRAYVQPEYTEAYTVDVAGTKIPVFDSHAETVFALPPQSNDDVLYIVTGLVQSLVDRDDLVSPARIVKGKPNQPLGCRAFMKQRYAEDER